MKHFLQNQWHNHRQRLVVCIATFMLVAGFAQAAFGLSYVLRLTPIMLTILVCVAVVFWDAPVKAKLWASAIIVFGGFIVELIGVHTGLLFGDYGYGKVMGFTAFGVPVTIGVTWLLVSMSAWNIVALYAKPLWQKFLLGGVLAVMFDIILEQFAVAYGLWAWQGNTVPLLNYATWFGVSMLWFLVLYKLTPKSEPSFFAMCMLPLMAGFFWLMLVIA